MPELNMGGGGLGNPAGREREPLVAAWAFGFPEGRRGEQKASCLPSRASPNEDNEKREREKPRGWEPPGQCEETHEGEAEVTGGAAPANLRGGVCGDRGGRSRGILKCWVSHTEFSRFDALAVLGPDLLPLPSIHLFLCQEQ